MVLTLLPFSGVSSTPGGCHIALCVACNALAIVVEIPDRFWKSVCPADCGDMCGFGNIEVVHYPGMGFPLLLYASQ